MKLWFLDEDTGEIVGAEAIGMAGGGFSIIANGIVFYYERAEVDAEGNTKFTTREKALAEWVRLCRLRMDAAVKRLALAKDELRKAVEAK